MAASYPGSLKSYTDKTDKVDLVEGAHVNSLQEEVVAIETELGTDVAGSKTDLKTRPIFHHAHDAIKAHVLLCFMALMMGKFLEIKTGLSLRYIRDILWNVHEANIEDSLTGKQITLQSNLEEFNKSKLSKIVLSH